MRGISFPGGREIRYTTVEDPTPGPDEVVIEIKASGMCGSDLHDYRADASSANVRPDLIRGHEPAGIVVATGSNANKRLWRDGARVMVHHYYGCTTCNQCRSGWPQLCTDGDMQLYGSNAHGCHASYMKVPAATLVPLDESLSFESGAAISCGTGTAWGALSRLGATGRETIAVFGQGPVGLSATMIAAAQGLKVIALDVEPTRLELAKEFGADATINPAEVDSVARIRELTGGKGAELSLETSGASTAGRAALDCLAVWGRACFVGLGTHVHFDVEGFLDRQITVMTSWSMSSVSQKQLADFAIRRRLNFDRLFTSRWSFDQAAEAYQAFDKQSGGKGVFIF